MPGAGVRTCASLGRGLSVCVARSRAFLVRRSVAGFSARARALPVRATARVTGLTCARVREQVAAHRGGISHDLPLLLLRSLP